MNGNVFNLQDSNLPPVWDSNIPKLLEPYSINIVSGKKKMCTDHLITPKNHIITFANLLHTSQLGITKVIKAKYGQ